MLSRSAHAASIWSCVATSPVRRKRDIAAEAEILLMGLIDDSRKGDVAFCEGTIVGGCVGLFTLATAPGDVASALSVPFPAACAAAAAAAASCR